MFTNYAACYTYQVYISWYWTEESWKLISLTLYIVYLLYQLHIFLSHFTWSNISLSRPNYPSHSCQTDFSFVHLIRNKIINGPKKKYENLNGPNIKPYKSFDRYQYWIDLIGYIWKKTVQIIKNSMKPLIKISSFYLILYW